MGWDVDLVKLEKISEYISLVVEPAFEEYAKHQNSSRLAFTTCVLIYHCVDRFPGCDVPGEARKALTEDWCCRSMPFAMTDMFAHSLKHVRSRAERKDESNPPKDAIPFSNLLNTHPHNLFYIVKDSLKFIREQAESYETCAS